MSKKLKNESALSGHMFGSYDDNGDDDDEDDIVVTPRPVLKPESVISKKNLNDSSSGKVLKNSMERDSFLNAFLDRDVNVKHGN